MTHKRVARSKFRSCRHEWRVNIGLVLQHGCEVYTCGGCGAAVAIADELDHGMVLFAFVLSGELLTGSESRSLVRALLAFLGVDAVCTHSRQLMAA
jgi:hypothetical protein